MLVDAISSASHAVVCFRSWCVFDKPDHQPTHTHTNKQTYRRIVRVDLKFPEKPAVSDGAKDFIRKVRGFGGEAVAVWLWLCLLGCYMCIAGSWSSEPRSAAATCARMCSRHTPKTFGSRRPTRAPATFSAGAVDKLLTTVHNCTPLLPPCSC